MTLIPGFHRLPPPFPLRSKDGGRRWRSCTSNLTVGEDFRETNFKKIQQLLDKCVAHEYGMKTNALALKREYLTEAQMNDYIRQEIFNVTENLVSLCQKNRALHNIRFDILMPDFLWESGFFENLSFDERKKYISFQCSRFWGTLPQAGGSLGTGKAA